ncbi:MAG: hypothetical protein LAN59_14555, partial [Acidobacteriia bacterium]|nr:hypothetical protein [Terriglobia bacterium]
AECAFMPFCFDECPISLTECIGSYLPVVTNEYAGFEKPVINTFGYCAEYKNVRDYADALITISDYSRDRIVDRFGMDRSRVFVVGEAADPVFRKLENPAPGPDLRRAGVDTSHRMIAYVGGFSPHKNLEALVNAVPYTLKPGW